MGRTPFFGGGKSRCGRRWGSNAVPPVGRIGHGAVREVLTHCGFATSLWSIMKDLSSTFEILRKYDSATVANVVELFHVRAQTAGYMKGSVRAIFPDLPPIVGVASTATFRSAYPTSAKNAYLKLPEQLERMQELPHPRIAVIQDLDQPAAAATFGEVMCSAYRRFGCAGVITSGAGRDILQVRRLNFPVFASSVIVGHGYTRLEDIHVPVNIDGVTVNTGDIVHADANGVVLIPREIVEEVAHLCEEFVATEQRVLDYLITDDATVEGFQKSVEAAIEDFGKMSMKLKAYA